LLLFALALMSKPMLVTLPILMVLLDFWPLHRFTVFKESSQLSASEGIELGTSDCQPATIRILILEKLPFFALSAASCVITFLAQRAGGAVAALEQLPLAARTSNAVVSYVRYLVKLVWPADLAVIYPFQAWPVYLVWLAMLILAVVTLLAWRQRHHRPYLLVGWAWYLGALVPVIGIVQVGAQSIADRYTYLPSVGLFVALAWGVTDILRRSKLNTLIPAVVTASCLLVLSLVAQRQVACWQNTETLFRHAIAVTSNNSLAFNSLGRYFAKMHAWREAENSYRAALRIDPRFHNAWNNLGCALIDQGRCVEAITNCQKAIEFDSSFAEAHSNLGTALLNLGRTEQAISRYAEALRLRPDYEQAHYNLANALASQGRISEAREHFEAALKLNPLSASAHSNCGFMLAREGNFTRATTEFRSALALDPTLWQAHFGLGHALANLGQPAAAASEFAELLRFRPDDATARAQLELCQARMRSEGVQELRPGQAQ
jgi:tetratricopeptide (TPR) repeat protein